MAIEDVISVKLEVLHSDVVEMKKALSELSKAITKLALVEQQQNQTAEALERAFKAISKLDDRTTALELAAPKGKETSAWVDRLVLGVIMLFFSIIGSKIGIKL